MGKPEMTLVGRRLRNASLAAGLFAVIALSVQLHHVALRDASFLSGWLLVAAFVVLALYNARKKIPVVPLGASASWMQLHIYLGLIAGGLFVLHVGTGLPSGVLETVLWACTLGLIASGLVGLAITRLAPKGLTEHGERLIFERIPRLRRTLAEEVRADVEASTADGRATALADYYRDRLHGYFSRPRHLPQHLLGSRVPVQRLCREVRALERYLRGADAERLAAIEERIVAKDNLDYQYAWQGLLKGWLFVHLPLTYATAVFAVVHVGLVYAFASATP
jgi:hypothetical protein